MKLSLGKAKAYNLILSKYETNNKLRIELPYRTRYFKGTHIEILLDGVIYEEELHQQTVLDSNACNSGSTRVEKALYSKKEADLKNYITDTAYRCIKNSSNIGKYHLYIRLPIWTGITGADIYNIMQNTCRFSNLFMEIINVNIRGKNINHLFTLKDCETIFAKIISKVPSKFWDDCMVIYTLDKYLSIDHAAKEWFKE